MKCGKRFVVFLLVSLLGCSLLLAFPGRTKRIEAEDPVQETQAVIPVIPQEFLDVVAPPVQEEQPPLILKPEEVEEVQPQRSEASQEAGLIQLAELLKSYDKASQLNKNELTRLIAELEAIKGEYEIICQDIDAKELQINDLTALNAQQADDLAYIKGQYDKESGTKAFAKVGAVIGFQDHLPTWGLSSSLGLRFGKGLLLEAGAQYMFGNFVTAPVLDLSLDNLAITASIGWEW